MPNNQKSLSSQFTRINTVIAFLVVILGIGAIWGNSILTEMTYYYNPTIDELQSIYDSISQGHDQIDWQTLNLPDESYGEIIDNDYNVLYASEGGRRQGYQYSVRVFNESLNNPDVDMMVYYPYVDDREMLVLYMPLRDVAIPYQSTLIVICLFIAATFMTVRVVSTFSARQIIYPVEKLSEMVHKIRAGAYGTTIALNAGNDIDTLAEDINELSHAIDKEIRLRESLENSRQQLILDISHDLKTPLTNIIGYSESLSTSEHLSQADMGFLDAIKRNGQRANHLLSDLFTYSKLNAVEYKLEKMPYDLRFALEEFIAGCIPDIEQAKKNYEVDFDAAYEKEVAEHFKVLLDIQSFRRILHNLVDNFIHHSGDGTTIAFRLSASGQTAVLDIVDDGVGIPAENRNQIFDPFRRLDTARSSSTGGSGLGLSITQKIIELHGGTIKLLPTSRGTHFQIMLPLLHQQDGAL